MAARKKTGLAVGQLLTLTFGFLLASVIIFVFGIWVGRDLSRERDRDDRPVVVRRVETPGAEPGAPDRPKAVIEPAVTAPVDPRPTRPRQVATFAKATRTTAPTRAPAASRTPTARPAATKTAKRGKPTVTAAPAASAKALWTVQATATNDEIQAVVGARTLRSKGYDAFTVKAQIGGTTWYRIQVGKFKDKKEAEKLVARLRRDGMEAAYVDRLR